MDALQELVALEHIKRLKARYFYTVDTRDCEGWLALWAPDGSFQWDQAINVRGLPGDPGPKFVGKELRRVFDDYLYPSQSVHIGHMPILEILSDTEAKGIWGMEDLIAQDKGRLHGWGHYHETYRKIDGVWKLQTSHLTRLRLEFTYY